MNPRSSTSSSEQPFDVGAAPWALVAALLVVLACEGAVRVAPSRWVIPYVNAGDSTYPAVRHFIEKDGPAEVAVVGSSRARESIAAPDLRAACEAALGRTVTVGNYASPAAGADEVDSIVRVLLSQRRKPKLILYGISPLQLSTKAAAARHAGRLWTLDDWEREAATLPANAARRLRAMAMHNEAGRWCRLYAYRDIAWIRLRALLGWESIHSNPIAGDLTFQQVDEPDRRLADHPVRDAFVQRYLRPRMQGNRHPLGGEASRRFESILSQCRDAGVTIIVYEVPLSETLRRNYPRGTLEQMRRIAQRLTNKYRAPYLHIEDLGETFDETVFRDLSHLNVHGARRLTAILAQKAVIPALKGELKWVSRPVPPRPEGLGTPRGGEDDEGDDQPPGEITVPDTSPIDDQ
ncbi:MAG: hypothetical protein KJZ68_07425 [Phycisphaerales bacterium]|nr:hypothetical protein [Phycisphaerales bacterium]